MAETTERRRMVVGSVALAVVSVALYAQTVDFDFVSFDDRTILLAHPELYATDSPIEAIVLSHFPREEPLLVRDLSWWLDSRLFGFESPLGYHLGNVFWNALAVVLFASWLFLLRPDWRSALVPAALFAVIPVHVEPVAWVMGRKDLLSAALSFLVLILHAIYLREEGRSGARRIRAFAYAGTLVLYPLAVLAKFNALFLIPALALHALFFPYLTRELAPTEPMPWRRMKGAALSLAPHLALAVLLYAFYSWNLTEMRVTTDRGPPSLSPEHLSNLASFLPWVVALYARNLVSAGQHSISHPWPNTDLPMTGAELVGAAAIAAALLLASLVLYRRRRDLLFFFAAFFVLMVPYANIVYIGIWVADRYVYLTSGLVIAALVWGVADLPRLKSDRRLNIGAGVAVLICMVSWLVSTLGRVPVFADDLALFGYEVERDNPSTLSYGSLARAKLRLIRTAPPDEQVALLRSVEADIEAGLSHYEAQPWRHDSGYVVSDHLYYSKLLVFSTMTMAVRGAPPSEQLPILLRAHELVPHPATAEAIAATLLQMSEGGPPEEARALSRRSLVYFSEYVARTLAMPNATPEQREGLRQRLLEYYGPLPHLASEVEAIEDRLR